MKKKKQILICIGYLMVILLLLGCSITKAQETTENVQEETPIVEVVEEEVPAFQTIVISGVGDVMVHGPQLKAQYNNETGIYNFNNNFKFMKELVEEGDLAIANLETTFAGKEKGYSSYPMFNTPDELADALKQAGFKGIITTNNHTYDRGDDGLIRTLTVLEDRGLTSIGTRKSEDDNSYKIFEVEGIQVGVTAYTYETPRWGQYKTLNALAISKEAEGLIDSFSYEYLEEDLEKINQRIQTMKNEGAEIIVFYVHWGEEYQRMPNSYQKEIAQSLSNYGVDIIFGSHPHVVQPIEIIQSETNNHETLIVYSMGNFISNQRYEILNNRYTEDGLMVNVTMKKDLNTEEITLESVLCIPTWVHRYYQGGKGYYEIVPLTEALDEPEQYNLYNDEAKWRAKLSKDNTEGILKINDARISIP